ncbi:hypothetical protein [Agreia sp. Leaf244]|uniref:hypothetical protein n=1 Tax=Agreia sp. Leaf244 TaxID=1736305 RepID=UPI0012F8BE09|nr:hypothetical protein [Agreia sp. Leaf244]
MSASAEEEIPSPLPYACSRAGRHSRLEIYTKGRVDRAFALLDLQAPVLKAGKRIGGVFWTLVGAVFAGTSGSRDEKGCNGKNKANNRNRDSDRNACLNTGTVLKTLNRAAHERDETRIYNGRYEEYSGCPM